jgi:hypothetical protein
MASKSQEELERPAKGYELLAVEAKVDQALTKLDTLITQTNSLVTVAHLDSVKNDMQKDFEERMLASEKSIHQEYGPMKKNLGWFVKLSISAVLGIAVQAALLIWSLTGGSRE